MWYWRKKQDTEEDKSSTSYIAAVIGEKARLRMMISEEIKPVALCIVELCLAEGIS